MATKILWADDEIDALRPHIMFLEQRGFSITAVSNGEDAVTSIKEGAFDLVFVDEHMPGLSGLDTLSKIKEYNPNLPVVMITKSEEESIMNEAIGSKIADYLIKPVNPNQILLTIKRILDQSRLTTERTAQQYLQSFNRIMSQVAMDPGFQEWIDIYRQITRWRIDLHRGDEGLLTVINDQYQQLNLEFSRFIEKNYSDWLKEDLPDRPILSPDIIPQFLLPELDNNKPLIFIIVDCMRLDQWLGFESLLSEIFQIDTSYYYSILPTATPYSRNAIFAGLYPSEIEAIYPELWETADEDETSLNKFEDQLLGRLLQKNGIEADLKYQKVFNAEDGKRVLDQVNTFLQADISALVFNFVDTLVHKRSENVILKEIAPDEAAFRGLTQTWFEHSHLYQLLRHLSQTDATIIITTDHGSVRAMRDTVVHGDKNTSTSLRYKYGRSLNTDEGTAMLVRNPAEYKLPENRLSTNYLFAKEDYYFLYPNNYHRFQNRYKDSFQHGGISMEEMILPVALLQRK